ncbi:MAG: response regulator [Dehalococcoidia bacterium]
MSDAPIRLMIVDDNDLFREGLVSLLGRYDDILVVGQANRAEAGVHRASTLRPDVILMDCMMPGIGGVEATRRILAQLPNVAISMLTVSETEEDLFSAVRAGALGYLVKSVDLDTLHQAIVTLAAGGTVITPHLATALMDEFVRLAPVTREPSPAVNLLTEREREVLDLVAQGLGNREIAHQLVIAENTVKVHLRNILDKLQLRNRQHAAAFAVQEGLVSQPGESA